MATFLGELSLKAHTTLRPFAVYIIKLLHLHGQNVDIIYLIVSASIILNVLIL